MIDSTSMLYRKNIDDPEVTDAVDKFRIKTKFETGVNHISGGFAIAKIYHTCNDYFHIELKWGVQSDCEDNVHTEYYLMSRRNLEIKEK